MQNEMKFATLPPRQVSKLLREEETHNPVAQYRIVGVFSYPKKPAY